MSNDSGWETYSKLVLQQLETLSKGIEGLRTELQDVKEQLTKIKAKAVTIFMVVQFAMAVAVLVSRFI